jgi:hypothetical protein
MTTHYFPYDEWMTPSFHVKIQLAAAPKQQTVKNGKCLTFVCYFPFHFNQLQTLLCQLQYEIDKEINITQLPRRNKLPD